MAVQNTLASGYAKWIVWAIILFPIIHWIFQPGVLFIAQILPSSMQDTRFVQNLTYTFDNWHWFTTLELVFVVSMVFMFLRLPLPGENRKQEGIIPRRRMSKGRFTIKWSRVFWIVVTVSFIVIINFDFEPAGEPIIVPAGDPGPTILEIARANGTVVPPAMPYSGEQSMPSWPPLGVTELGGGLLHRQYQNGALTIDCRRRAAVYFEYTADANVGSLSLEEEFTFDPNIPVGCQQRSTNTYRTPGPRYVRGHMIPANHMGHYTQAIAQSNHMTNILPQAAAMNSGAWYYTEKVTECYRESAPVQVLGGPIWDERERAPSILRSHGVNVPSAFWKVLVHDENVIAWLIPNVDDAIEQRIDNYLISVEELESVTGRTLPIEGAKQRQKPVQSWPLPSDCNLR